MSDAIRNALVALAMKDIYIPVYRSLFGGDMPVRQMCADDIISAANEIPKGDGISEASTEAWMTDRLRKDVHRRLVERFARETREQAGTLKA